jgi:hypothetical protein
VACIEHVSELESIEREKRDYLLTYLDNWPGSKRVLDEATNRAGFSLIYAASYLFKTGPVRWALDPSLPPGLSHVEIARLTYDLSELDCVFITHGHTDHFSTQLMSALSRYDLKWFMPKWLLFAAKAAGIKEEHLIPVSPGRDYEFKDLRISTIAGWHHEPGSQGDPLVDTIAYLIDAPGAGRLFFPSDIRTYPVLGQSSFCPDWLFAHVWFGRNAAMQEDPPHFQDFIDFILSVNPKAVSLTHLFEVKRDPDNYWRNSHALRARRALEEARPGMRIETPELGGITEL